MSIIKEFRDFVSRGNVLDLAVAVIIGAAFGKIVSSAVNDVIMPPIGLLVGGVDFRDLKYVMKPAVTDGSGKIITDAVSINYGNFIQNIIDFLIIAIAVFIIVKAINSFRKKEKPAPTPPPVATDEAKLLTEIRDILKNQTSAGNGINKITM